MQTHSRARTRSTLRKRAAIPALVTLTAASVFLMQAPLASAGQTAGSAATCTAYLLPPTLGGIRHPDRWGSGEYGASRDHGARAHHGLDYVSEPGNPVRAPATGIVTRIGTAYPDDNSLKLVEISIGSGCVVLVFYVSPIVHVGDVVEAGQIIGTAQNLAGRYPGITEHVHVELHRNRLALNPTEEFAAAPVQLASTAR